uniref:E3 ubiquitin-protein ligase APD1-4 middle domain-containing protein n=2 Tax=Bactrocera dorsalis TaxID=27457 RepID=A0A034WLL9_BACDO
MVDKALMKRPTHTPPSLGVYHYYHSDFYYSMPNISKTDKMQGVKRVIVFCILIVILPSALIIIPLYLRRTAFADVIYPVAESDIIEIRDGISSIFCQQHSLRMNSNFNAFQLRSKPEVSTNRKHIRLKKSMTLPDDTLEYWGFYLLKGAKVHLKFCSRYDGSRILVVKGQRNLNTCGLLDHNQNKLGANFAYGHEQVKVFFEDIREMGDTVPVDEVATDKKTVDNNMEEENHGGEDSSEDAEEVAFQRAKNAAAVEAAAAALAVPPQKQESNSTQPTTLKSSKIRGKKLKKGSVSSLRNRRLLTNAPATASTHRLTKRENSPKAHQTATNASDAAFLQRHQAAAAQRKQEVYDQLYKLRRRSKREHVYDRKYSHGGNAINFTITDESNSVSSFETGLFNCYNGTILLAEGFAPSAECVNAHFLENGSQRMLSKHEITEDGYYYYIFYSDNDLVRNDIHAIFDIYKPTFQYSNISDSQACLNATNCTFPIGFLSDEMVIVEVPTRDGIEHEEDDITYLISTCHPRTAVYAIFPIAVLILILSCSFL